MNLSQARAVITGASQGLGKEIAKEFLKAGASVAICARDSELLNQAKGELEVDLQPGQRVLGKTCDVSSENDVAALIDYVDWELGGIDVLVTNAGISGPKGFTEVVDWREWARTIEVNLYGVLLPCRAVIPQFKTAGRGKVIVLSGGGATAPMPFNSAYAASKAAVVRLMETFAEELRDSNIQVNAVAPGALNTRFLTHLLESGPEKIGAEVYAKALKQKETGGASMQRAASLCVYLASRASDGITGKLISAQWDPWETLEEHIEDLKGDIFTLRRILPGDRGKTWGL